MKYKISIILPVYNVEKFIEEALNSILKQSIGHENLEIIMVNDCSTDSTGRIIDEYEAKYKNFKAIHLPENSSFAGKPRNVGIQNSTAPYIMFLDPDDYYLKEACETLYNKIISKDVDIVFGKYFANHGNYKHELITPFDEFEELTINNIHEQPNFLTIPPSVWTKIFKRDFIEKKDLRFIEGVPGEDLVFITRSFLKADGITFLNKVILSYRILNTENKSVTFNITKNYILGLVESYKCVCSICKKNNSKNILGIILENHLGFWLEQLILSSLTDSEKKEALVSSKTLFKEYINLHLKVTQKHLEPIFSNIKDENYQNAIISINSLHELLKNKATMENHIMEIATHLKNQDVRIEELNLKLKNEKKRLNDENQKLNDKNQKLNDKIKMKKDQIAELQTFKGYLNYKIRNVYHRLLNKTP